MLQASAANKKKAIRSTWVVGMNKALAQNVSQEKVRLFSEAFAKIQEATGMSTAADTAQLYHQLCLCMSEALLALAVPTTRVMRADKQQGSVQLPANPTHISCLHASTFRCLHHVHRS